MNEYHNTFLVEIEQRQREAIYDRRDRSAIARAKQEGMEALRKLRKIRKQKS